MNRREFIGIGMGVTVTPLLAGCRSDSKWLPLISKPTTVTQFCDRAELLSLGKAYTNMQPGEKDKYKLQDLILDGISAEDERQLLANLDKKKKEDFTNSKTVIVNGWVLSLTEARQCALYTLTAK